MTRADPTPAPGGQSPVIAFIAGGVLVLLGLQVLAMWRAPAQAAQSGGADELRQVAADLEATAVKIEMAALRMEEMDRRLGELERLLVVADDWEFVVDEVARTRSKVDDILIAMEGRSSPVGDEVPQPPELDWTQPELFGAARDKAAEVGIVLTKDEVRVPARFVLKGGVLEYLAVLEGGKLHESLVELIGNGGSAEKRRHTQFGARLNNAIQALGFTRGEPIRLLASGTRPAQGQPIYLFMEWMEGDEKVVVRAEDMVWNHLEGRPMESGSWVYVGSRFVEGMEEGEIVYAADLTAEAVATYSSPSTIIDTTALGAQDDTVFIVATPRMPEDVVDCTFILRREDREPTRTFPLPAPGAAEETDMSGDGGGDE